MTRQICARGIRKNMASEFACLFPACVIQMRGSQGRGAGFWGKNGFFLRWVSGEGASTRSCALDQMGAVGGYPSLSSAAWTSVSPCIVQYPWQCQVPAEPVLLSSAIKTHLSCVPSPKGFVETSANLIH